MSNEAESSSTIVGLVNLKPRSRSYRVFFQCIEPVIFFAYITGRSVRCSVRMKFGSSESGAARYKLANGTNVRDKNQWPVTKTC